jgi:hypothetical protein
VTDNGAGPDALPIDMQELLSNLTALHAAQLGTANVEAAKWQAVAAQAQRTIAAQAARIAQLEAPQTAAQTAPVAGGPPDFDG